MTLSESCRKPCYPIRSLERRRPAFNTRQLPHIAYAAYYINPLERVSRSAGEDEMSESSAQNQNKFLNILQNKIGWLSNFLNLFCGSGDS
jgi:hypothetical protein